MTRIGAAGGWFGVFGSFAPRKFQAQVLDIEPLVGIFRILRSKEIICSGSISRTPGILIDSLNPRPGPDETQARTR